MALSGKKIILGVTGGIAAYKAAELASSLTGAGADVHVLITASARKFIGEATFQGLTRHTVYGDVFADEQEGQIAHIDLADSADLVIVAPATANSIGKLAAGLADDMLTAVILATKAPVWIVPAMNVNMYAHPAVRNNLETLTGYGCHLIGPDEGRLACGWSGKGRMVEPRAIFKAVEKHFSSADSNDRVLAGRKIIVTAGPTREALDPVRFFSNYSSGKMGYAIAEAARDYGADVTLVSGPVTLRPPQGVSTIHVGTALEMQEAVNQAFDGCDAVIKAAAVADYRPASVRSSKIKKADGSLMIEMVRNPDILKELGTRKKNQILVGFAAETDHLDTYAREKLRSKNLDLIIANRAADGFGTETNRVTFYFAGGKMKTFDTMPKQQIAENICRTLADMMKASELL